MQAIWKYPLKLQQHQIVDMPEDAEIIHVREQYNTITLWAKVVPSKPIKERYIKIVGTGHVEVDEKWIYLGTCALDGGLFIWHVFEDKS